MERIPTELLYVLAIAGYFIFSYFAQRAARNRQQQEQPPVEEAAAPPAALEEQLPEEIWGRPPATPVAPAVAAAIPRPPAPRVQAAAPASRRVHPARALLQDKRDLRRAVVLMMVLGPCRSQEPPERR
jgi:hypothetical protein